MRLNQSQVLVEIDAYFSHVLFKFTSYILDFCADNTQKKEYTWDNQSVITESTYNLISDVFTSILVEG